MSNSFAFAASNAVLIAKALSNPLIAFYRIRLNKSSVRG